MDVSPYLTCFLFDVGCQQETNVRDITILYLLKIKFLCNKITIKITSHSDYNSPFADLFENIRENPCIVSNF